ncbi:MAG: hypothetical protein GEV06_02295 [Luteitalea sp.]|nr:hypothetical protein [Luteitalea sp.]
MSFSEVRYRRDVPVKSRASSTKNSSVPTSPAITVSPAQPVRLSELRAGARARVHAADLASEDSALLRAIGLAERCLVRVCKAGEPCIVQVGATRIGLSGIVAGGIFVVPERLD